MPGSTADVSAYRSVTIKFFARNPTPVVFTTVHWQLSRPFFLAPRSSDMATLVLLTLAVLPLPANAWNIPGHMLSGIIAYQILQQENPPTIEKVKAVLEKHPRYANQWQARLEDVPVADRDILLFMQAARWADDVRTKDRNSTGGQQESMRSQTNLTRREVEPERNIRLPSRPRRQNRSH
jgi:hypothetical protein